jgi:integrase
MAKAKRKHVRTYNDLEAYRKKIAHGEQVSDHNVTGLGYQKQNGRMFARLRVMNKVSKKRETKSWPMPTLDEFLTEAERAGQTYPKAARCQAADEHLEKVRAEARHFLKVAKDGRVSEAVSTAPAPTLTVAQLADKYLAGPGQKLAAKTLADNRSMVEQHVKPALGHMRVDAVKRADIETLHGSVGSNTPIRANRMLSLLSTMFRWAGKNEWREGNPAREIGHFPENKRERWLSADELGRLGDVLDRYADNPSAQAIKLLALTGARKSEVLGARWSEFDGLDTDEPTWTVPAIRTKKDEKIVRHLDPAAVALLATLPKNGPYLFPSPSVPGKPLATIRGFWQKAKREAEIDTDEDDPDREKAVIHTLRHTVASHIVSDGGELLMAARQLGHSSLKTTQRYAKLAPGKMRETMTAFGKKLGNGQRQG